MSDDLTPPAPATDAVRQAIEAHSARLKPGAAEHLAELWSDLSSMPPKVARDLVDVRIGRPEFALFRTDAPAAPAPTKDEFLQSLAQQHNARARNVLAGVPRES